MENYGKIISQADDSSKRFQMKCLSYGTTPGEKTGKGIDIETLYYSKEMDLNGNILSDNYKYYIFEYLKDECPYTKEKIIEPLNGDIFPIEDKCPHHFSPRKSDPNRYQGNRRKFYALYCLSQKLNGILVLVNYSDGELVKEGVRIKAPEGFEDQVRVMIVDKLDIDVLKNNVKNNKKDNYITYSSTKCMTAEQYAKWLIKMNQNCTLPQINN